MLASVVWVRSSLFFSYLLTLGLLETLSSIFPIPYLSHHTLLDESVQSSPIHDNLKSNQVKSESDFQMMMDVAIHTTCLSPGPRRVVLVHGTYSSGWDSPTVGRGGRT